MTARMTMTPAPPTSTGKSRREDATEDDQERDNRDRERDFLRAGEVALADRFHIGIEGRAAADAHRQVGRRCDRGGDRGHQFRRRLGVRIEIDDREGGQAVARDLPWVGGIAQYRCVHGEGWQPRQRRIRFGDEARIGGAQGWIVAGLGDNHTARAVAEVARERVRRLGDFQRRVSEAANAQRLRDVRHERRATTISATTQKASTNQRKR